MRWKEFIKTLTFISSVIIIILVLTILTDNPIFILLILIVPYGYIGYLVIKFIILREGGIQDLIYTIFALIFLLINTFYAFGSFLGTIIVIITILLIAIEYYIKPIRIFLLHFKYRYKMSKIKKSSKKKKK